MARRSVTTVWAVCGLLLSSACGGGSEGSVQDAASGDALPPDAPGSDTSEEDAAATPGCTEASLSPALATATTALQCACVDGSVAGSTCTWTVDDEGVGVEGTSSCTLPAGSAVRAQVVTCTLTPVLDGVAGEPVSSVPITIGNTPPTAAGVALSPGTGDAETSFVCEIETGAVDADLDPLTDSFRWRVDGTLIEGVDADSVVPGIDLGAGSGQAIRCELEVTDGHGEGAVAVSGDVILALTQAEVFGELGFEGEVSAERAVSGFDAEATGTVVLGPFGEVDVSGVVSKEGPDGSVVWCLETTTPQTVALPLLTLLGVGIAVCMDEAGALDIALDGLVEIEGVAAAATGNLTLGDSWSLGLSIPTIELAPVAFSPLDVVYAEGDTALTVNGQVTLPGPVAVDASGALVPGESFDLVAELAEPGWTPFLVSGAPTIPAASGTVGRDGDTLVATLAAAEPISLALPTIDLVEVSLTVTWSATAVELSVAGGATAGPFSLIADGTFEETGAGCLTGVTGDLQPLVGDVVLGPVVAEVATVAICVDVEGAGTSIETTVSLIVNGAPAAQAGPGMLSLGGAAQLSHPAWAGPLPQGTVVLDGGRFRLPNGSHVEASGVLTPPEGFTPPDGTLSLPDGTLAAVGSGGLVKPVDTLTHDGIEWHADTGALSFADGASQPVDGSVVLPEGSALPSGAATLPPGTWRIPAAGALLMQGGAVYLAETDMIYPLTSAPEAAPEGFEPPADASPLPKGAYRLPSGTVAAAPDFDFVVPVGFSSGEAGAPWSNAAGDTWDAVSGLITTAAGQPGPTTSLAAGPDWSLSLPLVNLAMGGGATLDGATLSSHEGSDSAGVGGVYVVPFPGAGLPTVAAGIINNTGTSAGLALPSGQLWEPAPGTVPISFEGLHGVVQVPSGASATHEVVGANPTASDIGALAVVSATASASDTTGEWERVVAAAVDGDLLEGGAHLAGTFALDGFADPEASFDGTLDALGAKAPLSGALETGILGQWELSGDADLAPLAAGQPVPLSEGVLSLASGPSGFLVSAAGTLTAVGVAFELETTLEPGGGYTFQGATEKGVVATLPSDAISATLSGEDGVSLAVAVIVPDLHAGEAFGGWKSDEDYLLEGASTADWSSPITLSTALVIGPDGASVEATLSGSGATALTGTVEGALSHGPAAGYEYTLTGDAEVVVSGLELSGGAASLTPGEGLALTGDADVGLASTTVSAVFLPGQPGWVFKGPFETTLQEDTVSVAGALEAGPEGLSLTDTSIEALGGVAAVADTPLTAAGTVVDPFELLGGASLFVGPEGATELDSGELSVHFDGQESTVHAAGVLQALEMDFPLETEIATDGGYAFGGPPQEGVIGGLPATDVTATVTNLEGVIVGATVPVPDLYDGKVLGPWSSDSDFDLAGATSGEWAAGIPMDTTLALGPDGAVAVADLGAEGTDVHGGASGPVTFLGGEEGYSYHLKGPAELAGGGLELGDGSLSLSADQGLVMSGNADVGLGNPEVVASVESGAESYAFSGPLDAELSSGALTVAGAVVIDSKGGVSLQEVDLAGLGGVAEVEELPLTAAGPSVDPYDLGGPAELMVGPAADYALADSGLVIHVPAEGMPLPEAFGSLPVGGKSSALLVAPIAQDGAYTFNGPADLPIDTAKLGAGLVALSNLAPATWSGSFDQPPFDSASFTAAVAPSGDMTATASASLGSSALELDGSMTYTHCETTESAFCDALGTTFEGTVAFSLTSAGALELGVKATAGDAGELLTTAGGLGSIPLPDGYQFTDGAWSWKGGGFCFQGKIFGAGFDETCLNSAGPWSITSEPTVIQPLGIEAISGPITVAWDGESLTVTQESTAPFEGVPFPGDAVVGLDTEGNAQIISFESTKPADAQFTIPPVCTPFGCGPSTECIFDGDVLVTIEVNELNAEWCGTASCLGTYPKVCAPLVDGYDLDLCDLFGLGIEAEYCTQSVKP